MAKLNIDRKAQATLETTLAFVCVLVLLLGAVRMFVWFTERITRRQEDYEATRVDAGDIIVDQEGVIVDESNYPPLDIFNESN